MSDLPNLQDIKARYEAATEGPWRVDFPVGSNGYRQIQAPWQRGADSVSTLYKKGNEPDATFIAHSRADVPALVAALEAVINEVNPRPEPNHDQNDYEKAFADGVAGLQNVIRYRINQHLTIGDKQ